eukprot:scaffold2536_cov169-Amphora_coffeaeformis.AAC.11
MEGKQKRVMFVDEERRGRNSTNSTSVANYRTQMSQKNKVDDNLFVVGFFCEDCSWYNNNKGDVSSPPIVVLGLPSSYILFASSVGLPGLPAHDRLGMTSHQRSSLAVPRPKAVVRISGSGPKQAR